MFYHSSTPNQLPLFFFLCSPCSFLCQTSSPVHRPSFNHLFPRLNRWCQCYPSLQSTLPWFPFQLPQWVKVFLLQRVNHPRRAIIFQQLLLIDDLVRDHVPLQVKVIRVILRLEAEASRGRCQPTVALRRGPLLTKPWAGWNLFSARDMTMTGAEEKMFCAWKWKQSLLLNTLSSSFPCAIKKVWSNLSVVPFPRRKDDNTFVDIWLISKDSLAPLPIESKPFSRHTTKRKVSPSKRYTETRQALFK